MMRKYLLFCAATCALFSLVTGCPRKRELSEQAANPGARLGFSSRSIIPERGAETKFTAQLSTDSISEFHRAFTRRPHIAGSPASMAVAEMIRKRLEDAGLETEVHEFQVYLSTPQSISVELVAPTRQPLNVREPANPLDPDSANPELVPAFVAYSASGEVQAPVVYVDYGLPPDYAKLDAAGIDVRGKIVMARYAKSHRAVKIHTAQEHGAAAIIIYSDPADDGYAKGLTWPEGPWRADFQSQDGNGKYSWFWHGDPLSPGVGARADSKVLDPATAPTLPRIPAIVLSYKEAAKILAQLRGPGVPGGFQGGLPFTYRVGPGPAVVHMKVQMDASRRPIHDIIARLRGRNPDRWVVLGTHHDAWTFGGMDPGSGASGVFETARALAALAKQGWKPERSIVFAFWDAEEPGLVGSTEFAEAFEHELRQKAVVYINTDLFMQGHFFGGGTPSLRDFVTQVTRDVPALSGRGSLYDEWRAYSWQKQPLARRRQGPKNFEVELAALGSGADFVAFQDYLGLPTLSLQFDFEGSYGAYHSNYDSRYYVEHFSDPGFHVARTLAQVFGVTVMRLAGSAVLPYRYSHYARMISGFLDDASGWAVDDDGNQMVQLHLENAKALANEIATRSAALEQRIDENVEKGRWPDASTPALNDRLTHLEQDLLDESGSPEQRWYRHVIYGWNIYSLYDGQPLPGLAEGIRLKDPARVAQETTRIENALRRMLAELRQAGGS
ncbi:MAG TPA: M28 family peptidase [Bryobacteraceae bacterium]|nr:M28 family peptidase [Bryobacteraceae bacterium]